MENTHHGWANYETWNVALYIQNEEPLYRIAVNCDSYSDFLFKSHRIRGVKTPDEVFFKQFCDDTVTEVCFDHKLGNVIALTPTKDVKKCIVAITVVIRSYFVNVEKAILLCFVS